MRAVAVVSAVRSAGALVMWLGGLLVLEAGLGSSILPSGVHSSRGEISCGEKLGQYLLGQPG